MGTGDFEELVADHGRRVHAYLARRAPAAADDLLGEVWLAAYRGRRRFDPARGEGGGWLFGIARNVLHGHLRSEQRRNRAVATTAEGTEMDWVALDARLDAAGSVPELRAALATIPAEEREVLVLVAWEQLSPTEVAAALGIPAGTARSRLHRARARLREAMPGHAPFPHQARGVRS